MLEGEKNNLQAHTQIPPPPPSEVKWSAPYIVQDLKSKNLTLKFYNLLF